MIIKKILFNWQKKVSPSTDVEGTAPSMDVSEPLTQNTDRRLVYEPNQSVNSKSTRGGEGPYTPGWGPHVVSHWGDRNQGGQPSNSRGRGPKTKIEVHSMEEIETIIIEKDTIVSQEIGITGQVTIIIMTIHLVPRFIPITILHPYVMMYHVLCTMISTHI